MKTKFDIEIHAATIDSETFAPIPATEQRERFGMVLFGKKQVRRNFRRGGIEVKTTTISRDYNIDFFSYAKLAELIDAGKPVEIQK